jgi:kynurenine formamidase
METTSSETLLSEQTEWPGGFGNWGRWANDRGTLNLITPERVLAATRSVRLGAVFPVSAPLATNFPDDTRELPNYPAQGFEHMMLICHEMAPGNFTSGDRLTLAVHSLVNTHIDALSHVGHLGKGFNGVPVEEMVSMEGAHRFDITQVLGFVTRAILVDVPRIRGVEYLEPGDSVSEADLVAGASHIEPGDALLVRTGRWLAPTVRPGSPGSSGDRHGDWAAMNINAMRFIADRDVSVLATDSVGDTFPLPFPDQPTIHILAEVYLGMPLMHSLYLEEVAQMCADENRTEVMLSVGTLNLEGGTGSPVTPICVL